MALHAAGRDDEAIEVLRRATALAEALTIEPVEG
jgi:hypothetical protein